MSKIYLQEYITPVANKYIVVGSDGYLTTGDINTNIYPLLIIRTYGAVSNLQVYKDSISVPIITVSDTQYNCNPTEFGIWNISCNYNGVSLSDTVNITEVTSYSVNLSS